ncbi:hypothetical protein jhhlp_000921 [Lomentospora prolificans]|uniref:DUF3835 domain-containing protein n=1 Tax=Lomentospora prolificans TaxID=41688 RepID=A0A2N3NJU5_9PEZI|nr:hypothetical protein jhhlp_000921 [Lomentospora prolificans]
MTAVKDSFLDLERHVRQLEANVTKLKKALDHWRQWDVEYEALKEEVQAVSEAGEAAEMARIRSGFEGDLVNKKEMDEIFGRGPTSATRTAAQVANILQRRLDYVGKNIQTLERQVKEAERKLEAANVISDPGATDENGLPITEIFERLDDDDNVISHELWTPGSKAPQVQEIMQKAGVGLASSSKETALPAPSEVSQPDEPTKPEDREAKPKAPQAPATRTLQPAASLPVRSKEIVSDVEPAPEEQPEMSRAAQRVQRIMDKARQQEEISKQAPVLPVDESPEDAALRRQMLDYTMDHSNPINGGMGEIVAVMTDLHYEDSDDDSFNSFEDDDEKEDDDEEDDDDDEDEYGRTTRRVVSAKYQERMLDLERRLGVQSRFTRQLASEIEVDDEDDSKEEGIGKIIVRRTEAEPSKEPPAKNEPSSADTPPNAGILKPSGVSSAKKSVKFAQELDIAPAEVEPRVDELTDATKPGKGQNPVSEFIIEQTGPQSAQTQPERPRKISRFQKMKAAASETKEEELQKTEAEQDTIMQPLAWSDTPTSHRKASKAASMDGFDEEITQREIADEYHRRRRRMIQQQGGFLKEEQNPIEPIGDDGEPPQRMSRFKAARLAKD